jgi:hypothetical protein
VYAVNKTRLLGGFLIQFSIFYHTFHIKRKKEELNMDKKELLELIEEKIDDVFLEYQKKNDIKSGDISPEQALRLDELQNELADLVMHVGSRQEEHS